MAQVSLAAVVVLAVMLLIGCVVVARLQSEVRRLAERVASMELPGSRQEAARPPAGAARPPEAVRSPVVITQLDDSQDPSQLTTAGVASVVLAKPLIKTAAFAYGVRRALDEEHRIRVAMAFRQELRRQRKLRRRAMRAAPVPESGP
jgi:outer membrane murein-binding lipoprotein Lpp